MSAGSAMMTGQPLLECRGIAFAYGHAPVLEDISLTVHPGQFVGIVGPNGSGKTTLLHVMLGLLAPSAGEVRLFGEPAARFRDWWRIGYVPQRAQAIASGFPGTALEVVLTGRRARRGFGRRLRASDTEQARAALARVGLDGLATRPVAELSGGQQQRVFIARALASDPDLLVLDEPTVGVDVGASERFYDLLQDLRQRLGLTIVMVTHDIGVVAAEVSDLVCLNRTLFYHGPPEGFDETHLCEFYGHHVTLVTHRH